MVKSSASAIDAPQPGVPERIDQPAVHGGIRRENAERLAKFAELRQTGLCRVSPHSSATSCTDMPLKARTSIACASAVRRNISTTC
jgi:hypothetical protein